ncbi:MAG: hypothetical protein J6A81_09360 [Peptococcaceae bacterium]|nr:hypothetical protein [Peptococcaceae bacterium]
MAVQSVVAIINGVSVTLNLNASTGKYEGTLTAPAASSWNEEDHKYGITVTATDDAGNKTTVNRDDAALGDNLQVRVLEKTKPTIAITSPSSGARVTNAKQPIVFQIRDSESGIDIDTLTLKIDSQTAVKNGSAGMSAAAVSGGYNVTYTPQTALAEGAHTVTINVSDNDGNAATAASSSFTVDTVPPALNISTPQNNLVTNTAKMTVSGTTSDATSNIASIEVFLNNASQGKATVSGNSWTKEITLANGVNTIKVVATDNAGLTSTVERTVTLDTGAPVITDVVLSKSTVDAGNTFTITVTVTD